MILKANAKDGWAIDWPIRYKDVEPWYDHVEEFIGVSGSIEGLPQLPDGHFLPPMDLTCVEKDVAARIKEKFNRHMIIGRSANTNSTKTRQNKLPVQKPLLGRLPVWWLFQYTIFYFSCSNENGKFNHAAMVYCYKNSV